MLSQGTGESRVLRPLSKEKFFEVVDPSWVVEHFSFMMSVSEPKLKPTRGTRMFSGTYCSATQTITFTQPYAGVILHELAHHICHVRGLNGHKDAHNQAFGDVLQELIDVWV